jgi:hypothetical protein
VLKIKYAERDFSPASIELIETSNAIIDEFTAEGFTLTLLYYQLVSRDVIPNKQTEYKRLGSVVNDARLVSLIDWEAIEDRTRNLKSLGHGDSPSTIVEACARSFWMDHWARQKYRPEVWIEKDALVGIIEAVCEEFDVPYFSCRGLYQRRARCGPGPCAYCATSSRSRSPSSSTSAIMTPRART